MEQIISTETLILVTFLCGKMPNLLKYLKRDSFAEDTNETDIKKTRVSVQEIQKAKQHPSDIIHQTLATAAVVQKALDATEYKIQDLLEKKEGLEESAKSLSESTIEKEVEAEPEKKPKQHEL